MERPNKNILRPRIALLHKAYEDINEMREKELKALIYYNETMIEHFKKRIKEQQKEIMTESELNRYKKFLEKENEENRK